MKYTNGKGQLLQSTVNNKENLYTQFNSNMTRNQYSTDKVKIMWPFKGPIDDFTPSWWWILISEDAEISLIVNIIMLSAYRPLAISGTAQIFVSNLCCGFAFLLHDDMPAPWNAKLLKLGSRM